MNYFEVISLGIILPYIAVISVFTVGFLRLKTFFPSDKKPNTNNLKLSVLIPFRNEEKNLPFLFKNLEKQSLGQSFFEIIFIDDFSEDKSAEILKNLIKDKKHFKLISNASNKQGKKHALKAGIQAAESDFIVTTDADCIHPKTWLQTIQDFFYEKKPKLIIAPVIMNGNGFFGNLQALEFLSLISSAAGAAAVKHPIMCNGANLAFQKSIFNEFDDAMNLTEVSGDDVFLLHSFKKKYPDEIKYLKSNDAVVRTNSEPTFKSFLKQRVRWASKSKSYKDIDTIFVSIIVFLTNLLLPISAVLSFFGRHYFLIFSFLFLSKVFTDFILLSVSAYYFKQIKQLIFFPVLSLVYPFYIIFTAIIGLFNNKAKPVND